GAGFAQGGKGAGFEVHAGGLGIDAAASLLADFPMVKVA
ncbi:MAG: hypothetical protein RIR37_1081, partial [Verrucomicrobiota bacterium]